MNRQDWLAYILHEAPEPPWFNSSPDEYDPTVRYVEWRDEAKGNALQFDIGRRLLATIDYMQAKGE